MSICDALKIIAIIIGFAAAILLGAAWGILQGLWNNPMLILFIAGLVAPGIIIRQIFKYR